MSNSDMPNINELIGVAMNSYENLSAAQLEGLPPTLAIQLATLKKTTDLIESIDRLASSDNSDTVFNSIKQKLDNLSSAVSNLDTSPTDIRYSVESIAYSLSRLANKFGQM